MVSSVAFSGNGSHIVSGSYTNSVSSVAFSTNPSRIISGSWDKTIRVWNVTNGELVTDSHPSSGHGHNSVSFPSASPVNEPLTFIPLEVASCLLFQHKACPRHSRHSLAG